MGPAIGRTAALLGKPFMPWQQYVADVIGEVDGGTGRLVYDEFGLTVPRQSGKSTFVLAKFTHRCTASSFFGNRQHLVYTAQTRAKAREKWEEDYAAQIESSRAFSDRVVVKRGPGDEHLRFQNGSRFGIEANTEKAGHGGTLDEAYIDEAFAQVDFRLEQAFGPAMITRVNKMLGWISTAGWLDASPYLEEKVALGRSVVNDRSSTIAYFDWSADPTCDPSDEDVWRACMPALGHTISIDAIRSEFRKAVRANKVGDFKRAYLNVWVPKGSDADTAVIDLRKWSDLADRSAEPAPHVGRLVIGVDSDPYRTRTSIVAAGARAVGAPLLEVIASSSGVEWAVGRLVELCASHSVAAVVVDKASAAASLIPALEAAKVPVIGTGGAEMKAACGQFYDAATESAGLVHLDDPLLAEALKVALIRPLGDAWAWDRKKPTGDITPLVAATLALWGHTTGVGVKKNAGSGRVIALS